ncbi:MAG: RDD family protein [Planctomycetota bacterium]
MKPSRALRRFLHDDDDTRRREEIQNPDGVALDIRIASAGDRIGAFLVDTAIISFTLISFSTVILLLCSLMQVGVSWIGNAIALAGSFLLRNFYFTFFELRWQGTTPGKRRFGLRVIDRNGGPLRTEAIIVRNATRDLEVFFPLTALFFPETIVANAPAWGAALSVAWLFAIAAFPCFNRYHLRMGDLIAGTLVVAAPKELLLTDLAGRLSAEPESPGGKAKSPEYKFTNEQLDIYGNYELQVLERLLREVGKPNNYATIQAVCEKVKIKIRWNRDRWNVSPYAFLESFYTAQRARLEYKMLLGKRQEFKKK